MELWKLENLELELSILFSTVPWVRETNYITACTSCDSKYLWSDRLTCLGCLSVRGTRHAGRSGWSARIPECTEKGTNRQNLAGQNPTVSWDAAEHFGWSLIHCSMNSRPANFQVDTLYVNPPEALNSANCISIELKLGTQWLLDTVTSNNTYRVTHQVRDYILLTLIWEFHHAAFMVCQFETAQAE